MIVAGEIALRAHGGEGERGWRESVTVLSKACVQAAHYHLGLEINLLMVRLHTAVEPWSMLEADFAWLRRRYPQPPPDEPAPLCPETLFQACEVALERLSGNRGPIASYRPTPEAPAQLVPLVADPRTASMDIRSLLRLRGFEGALARYAELVTDFRHHPLVFTHRGERHLWMGEYQTAAQDGHDMAFRTRAEGARPVRAGGALPRPRLRVAPQVARKDPGFPRVEGQVRGPVDPPGEIGAERVAAGGWWTSGRRVSKMGAMKLGIDFGTTRTLVAAAHDGRYPVAAFDTGGEFRDYLPGYAAHTAAGWVFGWEAAEAVRAGRAGSFRSLKRLVGRLAPDEVVPGAPDGITAVELATAYLRHLRQMLVGASNLGLDALPEREPLAATVAVPANASTRQRYLTIEAFQRAGFVVEELLNEPTAAAVEFAHRNLQAIGERSPKRYVVVYDLGGGTFDTSAVSLVGRRFELLDTEGIARIGGDDFDHIILQFVAEELGKSPEALGDGALEACREAKETLSANSRKLLVDLGGDAEPVVIDVATLYARFQPLVDRTTDLLGELFARLVDHGIDPENPRELGGIYMVGGSVQLPLISRRLRELYKRKIQLAPTPQSATAIGLAICGDPEAGIFVREASTRYFGVWREAQGGLEKKFDQLISKDTQVSDAKDLVVRRGYRPSHTIGTLRFIECTRLTGDGQPAGDVTPWGEVRFPYDPALADQPDLSALPVARSVGVRGEEIFETYTYGRDGTIAVDIENRTHEYRRHFVLGQLR